MNSHFSFGMDWNIFEVLVNFFRFSPWWEMGIFNMGLYGKIWKLVFASPPRLLKQLVWNFFWGFYGIRATNWSDRILIFHLISKWPPFQNLDFGHKWGFCQSWFSHLLPGYLSNWLETFSGDSMASELCDNISTSYNNEIKPVDRLSPWAFYLYFINIPS